MNYNIGGPSNIEFDDDNSSSFSSSEDGFSVMESITTDETIIYQMIQRNNMLKEQRKVRRGSIPGHIVIYRDREGAYRNLFHHYFNENLRCTKAIFCRRFRMFRNLFTRIVDAVQNHDSYFQQRIDAIGRLGLSPFQKATAAL